MTRICQLPRRRRRSRAPAASAPRCRGRTGTGAPGSASISRRPGREVARSLGPLGHDRDPPPGEWVEAQLAHSAVQDTHAAVRIASRIGPAQFRKSRCSAAYTVTCRGLSSSNGSPVEVLPAVGDDEARRRRPWRRARSAWRSGRPTGAAAPGSPSTSSTNWPYGPLVARVVLGDRQHDLVGGHRAHGDDGARARRILGHEGLDDERARRARGGRRRRRSTPRWRSARSRG